MQLVKLENIVKRYPMGKAEFTALHNIDLSFEKGEFSGVVGPSGSGKTTLLNIVGSLDMPSEGSALVMGKNIERLSHKQSAVLRSRHMGFIFQTCNLLPVYTAFENVEFPLLIMKTPEKERKKKVWDALVSSRKAFLSTRTNALLAETNWIHAKGGTLEHDETDIGKVKLGRHATVGLDAYPDVKVEARVNHIAYESSIVNNVTIYNVDLVPEKVPQIFRSGMSVNVDIVDTVKENVLLAPFQAIRNEGGKSFVLVSQGAASEPLKQEVKTGISDDKNVEIISGLKVTDKILVSAKEYTLPQSSNSSGSLFCPAEEDAKA